jgi:ribose-phosphate pyrophosphokinase
LIADLLDASGTQRILAVDLHSPAVESAFAMPVEHLSAIQILAEAIRPSVHKNTVIVSPDLGAVKMAEHYARILDLPVAIIHKTRISGEEVSVQRIVGDVCDKEVLVVDDMISTGGTVAKAIEALLNARCSPSGMKVAATHALLVNPAAERLRKLPIETIYVTDSVPAPEQFALPLQIASLAPILAEAIQRLHNKQSIEGLVGHR